MEVDVYADLLFLINAGMDGLCLLLTARLLHRRLNAGRLMLAAVMGGVYAVLALFWEVGQAVALGLDIAVCLLMCAAAFAAKGGRLLPAVGIYVVLSMVMGGVMTALFNLLNRAGLSELIGSGEDGIGAWIFLLVALIGGAISLWGGRVAGRSRAVKHCRVRVELNGQEAVLRGILDSGNLLRDPMGGRAVICVRGEALKTVLSPSLFQVMNGLQSDVTALSDTADMRRLRFIPTKTATGERMLMGVRPDRVTVTCQGRRGEERREVDAILAVGAHLPADTDALVPGELIP